jgi:hypothetical protein
MVAFLTVDVLRAHAASAFPRAAHGGAGKGAWPSEAARPHVVLSACWLVAPDGRLTCRWQTDVPALGPPPD